MEYAEESLAIHNRYRALHGVPPLKLNEELIEISQKHAEYLLSKNKMEHTANSPYGENLYSMSSNKVEHKPADAVKSWYDEHKKYDFKKEENDYKKTGHFTQLVWKETEELGVAYATNNGKTFVVATYNPPGNVAGEYKKNVLPIIQVRHAKETKGDGQCCCGKTESKAEPPPSENPEGTESFHSAGEKSVTKEKKNPLKQLLNQLKHFCCFFNTKA